MSSAFFLTGTDTEVGKTHVTCALLHRARQAGLAAVGLKPVAAGTDVLGQNDDVRRILAASSVELPADIVNPYCFAPAIAPHIAAAEVGVDIDFSRIAETVAVARRQADVVIVEGAGGFCVPFGADRNGADLAVTLGLPVILVVGMRLGCLNHALLTAEAIANRGLFIAGWVANRITPDMQRFDENLETLKELLDAPLLGVLPFDPQASPATAASHLDLPG
jgi:dethiobiotin synthetase